MKAYVVLDWQKFGYSSPLALMKNSATYSTFSTGSFALSNLASARWRDGYVYFSNDNRWEELAREVGNA